MNFTVKSLLILLLLIPFFSTAQVEEIYVDEDMNRMTKEQFLNNCGKSIYRCTSSVSDSLAVNILHSRFKFGRISPEVHEKLLSELYKNNETQTDQTIVLRFVDRHLSYESYVKHELNKMNSGGYDYYIFQNGEKKHFKGKSSVLPESWHKKNLKRYLYREKKCIKKVSKKSNSKVFHLAKYSFDSLHEDYKGLTLIKRNNYLEDIRSSLPDSTRFVIILPKGEYFSSEFFVHPKSIIPFLNNSDWSEYKRDLKYSNSIKYKKGYGFFKSLPYRYRNYYLDYNLTCF
ncbi:hypothetical protein [Pontimicrobium sp. SW4]|uniref:KTSC domain-containing protein n=1 Tax=Pontimicrobium sp. SW4 TaxID=3153519 RepID=A0AAU7BW28_9FLAO